MTNTNNSTTNNAVSSPTVPNFPLAFDTSKHNISCSSQPTSLLNGLSENVTVTHFSETHGAMERISVPSDNIFNAEITSPKLDNNVRAANNLKASETITEKTTATITTTQPTNPFLNMSPTTTTTTNALLSPQSSVIVTTITSTNPFIPTSNYSSPSLAISNPFRDGDSDTKPVAKIDSNALNIHTPVDTKEEEKKIADKVVRIAFCMLSLVSIISFITFFIFCTFCHQVIQNVSLICIVKCYRKSDMDAWKAWIFFSGSLAFVILKITPLVRCYSIMPLSDYNFKSCSTSGTFLLISHDRPVSHTLSFNNFSVCHNLFCPIFVLMREIISSFPYSTFLIYC